MCTAWRTRAVREMISWEVGGAEFVHDLLAHRFGNLAALAGVLDEVRTADVRGHDTPPHGRDRWRGALFPFPCEPVRAPRAVSGSALFSRWVTCAANSMPWKLCSPESICDWNSPSLGQSNSTGSGVLKFEKL